MASRPSSGAPNASRGPVVSSASGGNHLSPNHRARRGAARMNHRGIWLTATVLAVIVLLAQVAGASTRDGTASLATTASVAVEVADTVAAKSLPDKVSLRGREESANGIATASTNEAVTDRARTTEKTETIEDE